MKIAVVHGSNDLYGASRVLLNEIEALRFLGHRVTVLLPSPGPLTEALRDQGASVVIDTSLMVLRRTRILDVFKKPRLPPALRDADIVILWTLALVSYIPLLRLARKRFYLSVHELLVGARGEMLVRTFVSSGSFPVAACSLATKRWLISAGVRESRIAVFYPVFKFLSAVRPAAAQERPNPFLIAVVGRINGHKGHREVALAFQRASRGSDEWRLALVGAPFSGQDSSLLELEQIVRGDARISLLGQIASLNQLPRDVALVASFPTKPEPFGLVPVEAWELGIRTIGFDDGGSSEVLSLIGGIGVARGFHSVETISSALESAFASYSQLQALPKLDDVQPFFTPERRRKALAALLAQMGDK